MKRMKTTIYTIASLLLLITLTNIAPAKAADSIEESKAKLMQLYDQNCRSTLQNASTTQLNNGFTHTLYQETGEDSSQIIAAKISPNASACTLAITRNDWAGMTTWSIAFTQNEMTFTNNFQVKDGIQGNSHTTTTKFGADGMITFMEDGQLAEHSPFKTQMYLNEFYKEVVENTGTKVSSAD